MEELLSTYLGSFPTLLLLMVIALTLFTLCKGADILIDEAVLLSLHWGVPQMIVGATIVSLGTTLPEASVSVLAAFNGNADLALGNAIGSIIANTGLIIGVASMFGRLPVDKLVVERQGKIQLGTVFLLALVSLPFLSPGPGGNISRPVGILFVILLAAYIIFSIRWTRSPESTQASQQEFLTAIDVETPEKSIGHDLKKDKISLLPRLLKMTFGVALVIISSKILIQSVEITALRVGVPQSIIAATLVAFGTSLPELFVAVNSARKGHGELAIGNIVGANILNVLFVVGAAAAVTSTGLTVPTNYYRLQIPTMLIISLLFFFFAKKGYNEITKNEGLGLLTVYLVYLALNYV